MQKLKKVEMNYIKKKKICIRGVFLENIKAHTPVNSGFSRIFTAFGLDKMRNNHSQAYT